MVTITESKIRLLSQTEDKKTRLFHNNFIMELGIMNIIKEYTKNLISISNLCSKTTSQLTASIADGVYKRDSAQIRVVHQFYSCKHFELNPLQKNTIISIYIRHLCKYSSTKMKYLAMKLAVG